MQDACGLSCVNRVHVINKNIKSYPRNAKPPRFFEELKGQTCRRVDCDLTTSKFIPICNGSDFNKYKFRKIRKLEEKYVHIE